MQDGLTRWLFDPAGVTAHGFCLLWEPGLIWTHALSDGAVGMAYFSIPIALGAVARQRRDLIFRPVFGLFAAFILLCGLGHWLELATLWFPAYGLQGVVKAATAIASVITAVALWKLLPHALALPSSAQLREVNEALFESETRHRISFENSPVPTYMLDSRGVLTGVSKTMLSLLGYSHDEVIGRPIFDFGVPGSDMWVSADVAALKAIGELHDVERQFLSRSGDVIDALVSARVERKDDATWIVCVLNDVSARRRAEEALRVSEARLHQSQKMEAIGQLTGGIAHDFNNMLQGIAGGLDMMERRIEQGRPEDARRFIAAARQAVERAAGLTHRMLAFARRQSLVPMPVEPDVLVRGMEELIVRTVGPAVRVRIDLHDGIWNVLCDANQLESALLNLAINSRDAMPEGGELRISTADRPLTQADLSDQNGVEPGEFVEIAVGDTGVGMTPDVLARAFEPFFTTKPTGRGTGLGLSQLYGFVCQSGGFVRLDSVASRGTTVRMYLPRHADERSTAQAGEKSAEATDNSGMSAAASVIGNVLVVEDEECVRELVVSALKDVGCNVLEAGDGLAALRIVLSGERLDLLLTDVGLPGLNGRQLADAARERRPGLPIVLMTGYAGTALRELELAPGIELVNKPFALETLVRRVRSMLNAEPVG